MFIVECKPDAVLVSSLASVSKKKVEHASGKSQVMRKLMRNYENSIGITDEDPQSTQPPDIQKFKETKFLQKHKIRILYHSPRNNQLIILCPRLEEWIVEAATEANVNMNNYNLPNSPTELHKIINLRTEKLHQLIKELGQTSPRTKALRSLLKEHDKRRRR